MAKIHTKSFREKRRTIAARTAYACGENMSRQTRGEAEAILREAVLNTVKSGCTWREHDEGKL
jgi:hypothetical protein